MSRIEKAFRRFRRASAAIAAVAALVMVLPAAASAQDSGSIRGNVLDSRKLPVKGALVIATPIGGSSVLGEIRVVTDSRGVFNFPALTAASYWIKIQMEGFVPVLRRVEVVSGSNETVKVSLQASTTDIVALLRSGAWIQSPLRFRPPDELIFGVPGPLDGFSRSYDDASGSVQIFQRTIQTSEGATGGIGSQFEVSTRMSAEAVLTLRGHFSEVSLDTNGFDADLEFQSSRRRRSRVGLSLRQVSLPGIRRTPFGFSREVKFHYGDQIQWTRNLSAEYDAEFGSVDTYSRNAYFRPRMAMAWTASPGTTVRFGVTRQDPAGTVNRWRDGFDNTVFWPYARGQSFHGEVALLHLSHGMSVGFAAFNDRSQTQSLFAVDPRGQLKLLVFDGRSMSTGGMRVEFNRAFDWFSAGAAYTDATGLGVGGGRVWTFNDLVSLLKRRRFHMLTARFRGNVPVTKTEVTAVYRWVSGVSGLPIDPHQTFSESNDPTLSVMVAQILPVLRPFGGRVQAVVDARNIFEPSLKGNRYQLAQAPRLVKGGVNIRF